jgi:hypothetical protein
MGELFLLFLFSLTSMGDSVCALAVVGKCVRSVAGATPLPILFTSKRGIFFSFSSLNSLFLPSSLPPYRLLVTR